MAREKGLQGNRRAATATAGSKLAHEFEPDAITLDIDMPGMDGWAVLDRLKHHPQTRHIPVHIITGDRASGSRGSSRGRSRTSRSRSRKEALDESFAQDRQLHRRAR